MVKKIDEEDFSDLIAATEAVVDSNDIFQVIEHEKSSADKVLEGFATKKLFEEFRRNNDSENCPGCGESFEDCDAPDFCKDFSKLFNVRNGTS